MNLLIEWNNIETMKELKIAFNLIQSVPQNKKIPLGGFYRCRGLDI
jgi:hypothetical protein